MRPIFGRLVLAIAAVVMLTTCSVDPARAHDGRVIAPTSVAVVSVETDDRPVAVIAARPEVAPVILWPVLLAIAAVIMLRQLPRRAVVMAVVPLLMVVAFETGVHAVHHLDDARAGAECSVAVTAEHVTGAPLDLPPGFAPAPLLSSPLALAETPHSAGEQYSPGDGRAPPVPSA